MADASERIIILSAVILVVIIGQSVKMYKTEPIKEDTILTWRDMQIQIATSRENYTLGDGFTATIYLVNNRSEEVQMDPITSLTIEGGRDIGYSGHATDYNWDYAIGTVTTLPAHSKKKLADQYFTPEQTGEFIITSLGVNKTVLILEPDVDYIKEEYGESTKKIKSVDTELWSLDDFIDPEKALSHGFKGYVNVSYVSEMPARVIVSPGKILMYTIQLELIPHISEFKETRVVLDPKNSSGFGVGWGDPVPIFNDYIMYSPDGTIFISVEKPCNVTMILSVPEGLPGMSAYPHHLLGIGITADVPVVHEMG